MKQKIKTKKAAAKRFKITGSGKVKRYQAGNRHLLEHESSKKKRLRGKSVILSSADMKKVRKMIPGIQK